MAKKTHTEVMATDGETDPNTGTGQTNGHDAAPDVASHVLTYGPHRVPVSDLPARSLVAILDYGFRQMVRDAAAGTPKAFAEHWPAAINGGKVHSDVTWAQEAFGINPHDFGSAPEYAKAVADAEMAEKVSRILVGDFAARRGGGGGPRKSDLEREVYALALADIEAAIAKAKANGQNMSLPSATKEMSESEKEAARKARQTIIESYIEKRNADLTARAQANLTARSGASDAAAEALSGLTG